MQPTDKPISKTMQDLIANVVTKPPANTGCTTIVEVAKRAQAAQKANANKSIDPAVIEYLDKFPINNLSKLLDDYNRKIKNYISNGNFFNEITKTLLEIPEVSAQIELSAEPNWRGYTGLKFKTKSPDEAFDFYVSKKYLLLNERSKQKKLDFNLSLSDLKRLLSLKRCHYTGVVLTDDDPNLSTHRTFDRIDNKQGYIKGNVVVCSLQINQIKSNLFESPNSVTSIEPELLYKFVSKLLNK